MRKTITIAAIVIAFIGLAVIMYFFVFANQTSAPQTGVDANGNPFGTGAGNSTTNTTPGAGGTGTTGAVNSPTAIASRLVEITRGPVALGSVVFDVTSTSTGTTTADVETRYVDRASGNIYSYLSRANLLSRLTARTIPGVQEAKWLLDGSMAFVRFITTGSDSTQRIETYSLPANGGAGYSLASNIFDLTPFATTSVFTLSPQGSGSLGTITKSDGSGGVNLFTSPLTRLFVHAAGKNLVAYTPASAEIGGYVFLIDGKTGLFTRLLGPITGLTALPSPSGGSVLYSYVADGAIHLSLIDTATRQTTTLPVATQAEKCAWTADNKSVYCAIPKTIPSGTLPDDWYQGAVSYTDRIWRIDLENRFATLVVDLSTLAKQPIDGVSLSIDPKSEMLVFMNKRDGSLWAYDL